MRKLIKCYPQTATLRLADTKAQNVGCGLGQGGRRGAAADAGRVAPAEGHAIAFLEERVLVAVPHPLRLGCRLDLEHAHAEGGLPAAPPRAASRERAHAQQGRRAKGARDCQLLVNLFRLHSAANPLLSKACPGGAVCGGELACTI